MDLNTELDFVALTIGLLGGLSVFLFGMGQMTESLKTVAGEGMSSILSKLTRNRFAGSLTGALVTAVLQSSSVTTVLVVGFVSAGLMSLVPVGGRDHGRQHRHHGHRPRSSPSRSPTTRWRSWRSAS